MKRMSPRRATALVQVTVVGVLSMGPVFERSAVAQSANGSAAIENSHVPAAEDIAGNTLEGTTGLLRVWAADAGQAGTFRLALTETFYSGSGFLCPRCNDVNRTVLTGKDDVGYSAMRLLGSVTPLPFLEAFSAVRFRSVSNDHGEPQVMQVSGDTLLGIKAFLPHATGRIYSFGFGPVLSLLGKNRSVGPSVLNLDLMLAGTLDLRQLEPAQRIPLRVHLNLGYKFDNTGNIAEDIEATRVTASNASPRITRVERFGFGINRIDAVRFGIGSEWISDYVRPFIEWTLDVPANRQGYNCRRDLTTLGDVCSDRAREFSAVPSRLTLGLRSNPWARSRWSGIAFLAALDVGTGATSRFVEETAPELPWAVTLGLGYSGGGSSQVEVERVSEDRRVEAIAATPPELRLEGRVVEKGAPVPISGVVVRVKGTEMNPILTNDDGAFRSFELAPGKYTLSLSKTGYVDGECEAEVAAPARIATAGSGARPVTPPQIECTLARLPSNASVTGMLRDAETTEYVPRATVSVFDPRGRKVSLDTDEFGGFRFERVPLGRLRVQVTADGYLPTGTELELDSRQNVTVQLMMHKRPKVANVVLAKNELKLKRPVQFMHDSSEILTDSVAIVEEIAEALRSHPGIAQVEVQVHTDDSGAEAHNLALSTKRASALRDALLRLGIEERRVVARGYGQSKPLVPNTSPANRAKNRRVQLVITVQ